MKTPAPRDRLHAAYWQDGLLDLLIGLALVLIGLAWLADLVALGAVVPGILLPFWHVGRKRLVEPRLGYVKLDATRRAQWTRGQLALITLGLGLLLVTTGGFFFFVGRPEGPGSWESALIPALPAGLVGLGGIVAALLFQFPRLALYGVAAGLFGLATAAIQGEPGWSLFLCGGVPLGVGFVRLRRFVRTFPILPQEME